MAETFAFLYFCAFLNLIIILIKENEKKLTLCQRNEQTLLLKYIHMSIEFQIKVSIFQDESIFNLIYVTEKKLSLHVMEV